MLPARPSQGDDVTCLAWCCDVERGGSDVTAGGNQGDRGVGS